jgi:diguanylate cyclase (GGDEF)-like protein
MAASHQWDRITDLAAMLVDAPVAVLEVPGYDATLGLTASQRHGAARLCALATTEAVVVNDASADARFWQEPLVEGAPYLRFFIAIPILSSKGDRFGALCVADIQARHLTASQVAGLEKLAGMAADELERSAQVQTLEQLVDSSPVVMFTYDVTAKRTTYCNADARDFGCDVGALDESAVHPEDLAVFRANHEQLVNGLDHVEMTVRLRNADSEWRWMRVQRRVTKRDDHGKPLELAGAAADVTTAKRTERELEVARDRLAALVTTDELTTIANKRALNERLGLLVAEGERGRKFAVTMIDIDHFKKLNDTHGHLEGDRMLREVALTLKGCLRKTDFVARYGGEEFCVLFTDVDGAAAHVLAERLRVAIESIGGPVKVTASFGVSVCATRERADGGALLEAADKALYRAKNAGRNRVAMARRSITLAMPTRRDAA